MLTVLAGPVSGGQRYSLALFMALPLAVAAALLARSSRSADRLEVTEPDALPGAPASRDPCQLPGQRPGRKRAGVCSTCRTPGVPAPP